MAKPVMLQSRFERMVRDVPRNQMPEGSCWSLIDYIPHTLEAPLRKRGGWEYTSVDLSTTFAGATRAESVGFAKFPTARRIVAADEDQNLYAIRPSDGAVIHSSATTGADFRHSTFHRETIVLCSTDGTSSPQKYDGLAFGALGGSPPAGIYPTAYKDRTVMANSDAEPQRVWFSDAGTPESWDTTNVFVDVGQPVTGLAPLRNSLLVFATNQFAKITGSTPPPGSDFTIDDPLFRIGCTDARSIASFRGRVIFANPGGIHMTDGVGVKDLTEATGMVSYWQEILSNYDIDTWRLAGGTHRGYYIIAVVNGTTFVDAALIDIDNESWARLGNLNVGMFAKSTDQAEELYFASLDAPRIGSLSSIFMPEAANKNDADGTAVEPEIETPYYFDRPGKKTWKHVYVSYDIRDAATDNPTLTVSYIDSPEETSYTALTPTLSETTGFTRKRIPIRKSAHGLAFKIAQINASSDTRGYTLEADVHSRELSRV